MKNAWMAAARFIGVGWYVGFCIVGGFFLGRWIGRELENESFFSLLGIGVGILFAVYGIYAGFSLLSRKASDNDEQERR